jgi:HD-GYP domain-containing protein (c-di-GMP phosphodiesterase class II)
MWVGNLPLGSALDSVGISILAERITSLDQIARIVADDDAFLDFQIVREKAGLVEVRRGDTSLLLAEPSVWGDSAQVERELASCSQEDPLSVCVGSEAQLTQMSNDAESAYRAALALPSSANVLHRTLFNLAALIELRRQVVASDLVAAEAESHTGELVSIAAMLTSERDTHRLLELILEKSRYISGADAGSVYLLMDEGGEDGGRVLHFEVAQNESVEVDLETFTMEISEGSIVGSAVISGQVINIPDLYRLAPDSPFFASHDRSFDERIGYQTRSTLTVPMINARRRVIGVIQLINKKPVPSQRLKTAEDFEKCVVPFDETSIRLCTALAYQAAIALDNALLYEELQNVFEGFVEASILAIEARDPTTSGHSRRVADLTVGLAIATDRESSGPYADLHFGSDQLKEIEYAGLLHDFGKVGVPEQVLLKANKLYEWDLERILARFEYVRQWLRNETLQTKLAVAMKRTGTPNLELRMRALDAAFQKKEAFLKHCAEVVISANSPSVMPSEQEALLSDIANHSYIDAQGEKRPYLRPEELKSLHIRRGSLSHEERQAIESHVLHSFNFLCTIPWGRSLSRVAEIAGSHHEKLDGSGYPRGISADKIPVQAKMMTIVDIYDALTAADRPYKRALDSTRALDILAGEVERGKVDANLLSIFVEAKVFGGRGQA